MANDVYLVNFKGQTAGEYNEIVCAFQGGTANSTTPLADAQNLLTSMSAGVMPALLACTATDFMMAGITARRVNNGGGPTATYVAPSGSVGTVTGTSVPMQSSQLVIGSYKDTRSTKWRAGRINVASVPESGYTAPNLTPAQIVLLQAFITAIVGPSGSGAPGPWNLGVWSRKGSLFFAANWAPSLLIGTIRKRLHPVI
jgi:hypothetical protein